MAVSRWLPLGAVLMLLAILGWRSWWQRRRYGSAGVWFLRSARWQENLRDASGVLLVVLLIGQALTVTARPRSLVPGTALVITGLVLLVLAQLNLGASWRIGIEEGSKPGLVTDGFYRFCRNPIYFAILVFLVGYALLLPTRLSLIMLVGAFIGIRQQVLTEEAHLTRAYGDAYRAYARRVGRFVPGIGRLRWP
ncbi:MAG TPA: isoprenylcysteine carboxylmethyltransferase family protein [Methylomirabilota bacterium]|jgi:protein-S-isoprenylcysteine O-methyltransferase Ste14